MGMSLIPSIQYMRNKVLGHYGFSQNILTSLPVKEVQLKSIQGKRCQPDSKQGSVLTEFMINFVDPKLINTTKH